MLMPLLAMGLNTLTGSSAHSFLLINLVSLIACMFLLWRLCRRLGLEAQSCHDACLLFMVTVGFHSLRYYGVPDALLACAILAALLSGLGDRPVLAALTLTGAVLVKEGCILLLPATALWLWQARRGSGGIRAAVPSACVCLAAAVAFIVPRVLIHSPNAHSYFSGENLSLLSSYWHFESPTRFLQWMSFSMCYSLGPLWLLAALAVPSQGRFALRTSPFWLPFLLPLLLATDTDRMLTVFFPVVLPLAVVSLAPHGRLAARLTVACAGLLAATFFWTATAKNGAALIMVTFPAAWVLAQRAVHRRTGGREAGGEPARGPALRVRPGGPTSPAG